MNLEQGPALSYSVGPVVHFALFCFYLQASLKLLSAKSSRCDAALLLLANLSQHTRVSRISTESFHSLGILDELLQFKLGVLEMSRAVLVVFAAAIVFFREQVTFPSFWEKDHQTLMNVVHNHKMRTNTK